MNAIKLRSLTLLIPIKIIGQSRIAVPLKYICKRIIPDGLTLETIAAINGIKPIRYIFNNRG